MLATDPDFRPCQNGSFGKQQRQKSGGREKRYHLSYQGLLADEVKATFSKGNELALKGAKVGRYVGT